MPSEHPLNELARQVEALMDALGRQHLGEPLQARGWTFAYDRALRRLGACHYDRRGGGEKRLTLSRAAALRGGWAVMEDVARHEIAHALDVEKRGFSAHDASWKAWARRCGADPTRLYEGPSLTDDAARYVGVCPRCGSQRPFFRRPSRRYACAACCQAHAGGRYDPRFALVLRDA